ncbi:MAG: hypothetical protein ACE5HQ_04780 [Gemmatimonadota bacterium]
MWALVLIVVLLIPVLAIVIDSQVGQALAQRISSGDAREGPVKARVEALEAEVRYLSESLEALQEESQFLRSLIEGPENEAPALDSGKAPPRLET